MGNSLQIIESKLLRWYTECHFTVKLLLNQLFIKLMKYAVLSRRFRDSMGEYNWAQESYREKSKERIEKQLKYGKYSYNIYTPLKSLATLAKVFQVVSRLN